MAVTDLTNTIWRFKDDFDYFTQSPEDWRINFQCAGNHYTRLSAQIIQGPDMPGPDPYIPMPIATYYSDMYYDDTLVYRFWDYTGTGSFTNYIYRMIKIIDGRDVEVGDLIAFLTTNATQISGKEAFIQNMNYLADAINEKAGTTGPKTVEELISTVRSIEV